jgi:DNA-binding LacI/PurR family transcriptional regulator
VAITIKEIAEKAGVSRSTVSRALKDHSSISAATKQRVQTIAQELGYVPNYIAQSLSINRTRTIGVVITHLLNPFSWRIVEGVDLAAHDLGYSVIISSSRNDRARELDVIQAFQRRRVDGIIVSSSHLGTYYSSVLNMVDIPVVLINEQQPGDNIWSVTNDDYSSARMAVEYLLEIGHRQIGYVGILDRPRSNERRYEGYYDAMVAAGLTPFKSFHGQSRTLDFTTAHSDFETGREATQSIIETGLSAVFCYNDSVALGVIAGLRERGLNVPQDISVVGYDDLDEASRSVPPLTTIRQPKMALGSGAVQMLNELLEGKTVENRILPCELIIRDSAQPFASQL